MLVYDWMTRSQNNRERCTRGIVQVSDEIVEFGYSSSSEFTYILYRGDLVKLFNKDLLEYCYFNGSEGYYVLELPLSKNRPDIRLKAGRGRFPYSFDQMYEAIHSFDVFKDKQYLANDEIKLKYGDLLKYTFGLEFETSSGYIPEDICFRDGLIPLRDGSITGLEYSTIVLKGNNGLNFLKQQISTLDKYTLFDKECSLHIHMGVSSVSVPFVWSLYVLLTVFQNELPKYVPFWTFESNRYKRTGKNYCKKIPVADNFDQLYRFITGKSFSGSLKIPHPLDERRTHKWQVSSRYFAFNFVNLMCYESPKTIEFRFLRPTYNYNEIETWLFIFNALISCSITIAKECLTKEYSPLFDFIQNKYGKENVIYNVLNNVYPKELANTLIGRLKVINNAHTALYLKKDFYGGLTNIKETFYNNTDFKNEL